MDKESNEATNTTTGPNSNENTGGLDSASASVGKSPDIVEGRLMNLFENKYVILGGFREKQKNRWHRCR